MIVLSGTFKSRAAAVASASIQGARDTRCLLGCLTDAVAGLSFIINAIGIAYLWATMPNVIIHELMFSGVIG